MVEFILGFSGRASAGLPKDSVDMLCLCKVIIDLRPRLIIEALSAVRRFVAEPGGRYDRNAHHKQTQRQFNHHSYLPLALCHRAYPDGGLHVKNQVNDFEGFEDIIIGSVSQGPGGDDLITFGI